MPRIGKKIITPTAVPTVPGATGECPLQKPVARQLDCSLTLGKASGFFRDLKIIQLLHECGPSQ